MSLDPVCSATDLASCVLPVPAGPSTSTGLERRSARYTTPLIASSAREPTPASPPPPAPFQGRELLHPHRAARVQLLGGDAHLGAEPELFAVHEARRGVHQHGRS